MSVSTESESRPNFQSSTHLKFIKSNIYKYSKHKENKNHARNIKWPPRERVQKPKENLLSETELKTEITTKDGRGLHFWYYQFQLVAFSLWLVHLVISGEHLECHFISASRS